MYCNREELYCKTVQWLKKKLDCNTRIVLQLECVVDEIVLQGK